MLLPPDQKEKSVVRTFRLPERVCEDLKKEAEENRESLNTRVNQLLYTHLYDAWPPAPRGKVAFPKPMMAMLFDKISTKDARDVGHEMALRFSQTEIIGRWGAINPDTIMQLWRMISERSGFGECKCVMDRGKRSYTFLHELGPKGTSFIAGNVETLFQLAGIDPEDTSVTIIGTNEAVIVEIED